MSVAQLISKYQNKVCCMLMENGVKKISFKIVDLIYLPKLFGHIDSLIIKHSMPVNVYSMFKLKIDDSEVRR